LAFASCFSLSPPTWNDSMNKIVPAIDELRIASFGTAAEADGTRGTVRGHATAACTAVMCTRPIGQPGSCVGVTCNDRLTGYPLL